MVTNARRDAVDAAASGAWWCSQGGFFVRERTQRVDDRRQIRLCRGLSRTLVDHIANRCRRLYLLFRRYP
jgi:hypothetical protein